MEHLRFEDMNISNEICRAVLDMGFEEATPIQSQAIPVILEGKDIIGQSQTGTGKTAAFGIPLLERINPEDRRLQALILCPTRELAIQVSEEFRKLLKYKDNIRVLPIYGGQPIDRQIAALRKGTQVVIGTPGRVMDHMRRRTIKAETVQMMVLDEADEMLDMGFREDIETILVKIPEEHQTLLFSATLSPEILDITKRFQKNPEFIKIVRKELTVPNIEQYYFDVKEKTKLDALCRIIDVYDPKLAMVFCNTKKRVDDSQKGCTATSSRHSVIRSCRNSATARLKFWLQQMLPQEGLTLTILMWYSTMMYRRMRNIMYTALGVQGVQARQARHLPSASARKSISCATSCATPKQRFSSKNCLPSAM